MDNSPEINPAIRFQVKIELTNFIYSNLLSTIPLLALVSSMLVFKLNGHINNAYLISWLAVFLTATVCQGALAMWFKKTKDSFQWDNLYFKLLIADIGLIGVLWGVAGALFMPSDIIGQSFLIFIITLVAGGGSLYLTRSFLAGSIYVTGVLTPLIATIIFSFFAQTHHEIYFNITLGLAGYWLFLMTASYYSSKLFAENFTHSLINKTLSEDLSHTTEALEKLNEVARNKDEKLFLSSMHNADAYETLSHNKLEYTDQLTGVDAQEIMEVRFIQSRAYAHRHHQSLAVFCININNFNEVKNTLDQDIANLLLKTVAIRLQYCKRETDILSRGDENQFILIISEVLLGTEIMNIVNKIQKTFAEKTIISNNKVQINASIGISVYPKDGNDLQGLINNSRTALSYLVADKEPIKSHYKIYDSESMSAAALDALRSQ